MRQYAGWQAPFYSFWSRSFYVDVVKNWKGLGYLYLLLLLCFTLFFMAIRREIDFSYEVAFVLQPLINQLPVITVDKGILSINQSSPYTLSNLRGEPIITFNTSSESVGSSKSQGVFIVKQNKVIFKGSEFDKLIVRQWKDLGVDVRKFLSPSPDQDLDLFSTVKHAVVDKNTARESLKDIRNSLVFFLSITFLYFITSLPCGFIFCVLQSLIYGLLTMNLANANRLDLPYATAIRLATIALTPVLLLDSLLKTRGVDPVIWGPLALIITIAYIIFAVLANIGDHEEKSQSSTSV